MTTEDKIKNAYIWTTVGVASIVDNIGENELRWMDHVFRRETKAIRLVKRMYIRWKRRWGWGTWLDVIESDTTMMASVNEEDAEDTVGWMLKTRVSNTK